MKLIRSFWFTIFEREAREKGWQACGQQARFLSSAEVIYVLLKIIKCTAKRLDGDSQVDSIE
jgi:hypothetical protein